MVHLPVWARYKRANGWSQPYDISHGQPIVVPIDNIPGLEKVNSGYADEGEEGIEQRVKAATQAWIHRRAAEQHIDPRDAFGEELSPEELAAARAEVMIYRESDVIYFVRAGEDITTKPGWSFDAAVTRRTHGRPETHVLLGLPKRGIADMPDEMWGKMKLLPESLRDYQSEGKNCVVQQLALAVTVQYQPRDGSSRDGGERTKTQVPQLTTDEIEWHLDLIYEELYPGYYIDEAGNRKDPSRREPLLVVRSLDKYAEAWKQHWGRSRLRKRFSIPDLYEVVRKGNSTRYGIGAKAFHNDLKSAFWGERDLLKMYKLFFAGYPHLFTVYEGFFVAAAWHHYEGEDADDDRWKSPRPSPTVARAGGTSAPTRG